MPKDTRSEVEILMEEILVDLFGSAIAEHRVSAVRNFRFDYAVPMEKVGIEIDGGVWTQGRHTRGSGFIRDMEKLNLAAIEGWAVLRFTPQMVRDGTAERMLSDWIRARK